MRAVTSHSGISIGLYSTVVSIEGIWKAISSPEEKRKEVFAFLGQCESGVRESKNRILAALESIGKKLPRGDVYLNIYPADFKKSGSHLDLPIALTLLRLHEDFSLAVDPSAYFIGELGMKGEIRPVRNFLNHILGARKKGFEKIYCPKGNLSEIPGPISGIKIFPLENLFQLSNGPVMPWSYCIGFKKSQSNRANLWDQVKDMTQVKKLLVAAVLGRLNVLLLGTPGVGKSMICHALAEFLAHQKNDYPLEMAALYSMANLKTPASLPFRAPHHTITEAGMSGGGSPIRPGEVSLASGGILFLDELPEFKRNTLEGLRQPLEAGYISIVRASSAHSFPADFMFLATANPCPCGWAGDPSDRCHCSPNRIFNYQSKISGPILDRFDLVIPVYIGQKQLNDEFSFSKAQNLLEKAQKMAFERSNLLKKPKEFKRLELDDLFTVSGWDEERRTWFFNICESYQLNYRAKVKILRVARVLADLDGAKIVGKKMVDLAFKFRPKNPQELYSMTSSSWQD